MAQWKRIYLQINTGYTNSILELGRAPRVGNGTHSTILAWKILWTEESWYAIVHGVAESDTTE